MKIKFVWFKFKRIFMHWNYNYECGGFDNLCPYCKNNLQKWCVQQDHIAQKQASKENIVKS